MSLETPLVTEEGLVQAGEQVESEIESSFKLKPKKKSVTEESITLEQPTSVTIEQEQVITEDRVQETEQQVGDPLLLCVAWHHQ